MQPSEQSDEPWNCLMNTDANGPVDQALIQRAKKKKSISKNKKGDAFYSAAQSTSTPLLYFDVKYYGVCENIVTDSETPIMVNVKGLLQEKKDQASASETPLYEKGQIIFSAKGLAVLGKNTTTPVVSWFTHNLASMASVKYPGRAGRRIALLKVRVASGALEWHLFKYTAGKKDHMAECFRYIVDCSLREIGRAVASANSPRAAPTSTSTPTSRPQHQSPNYVPPPMNAWEQSPPPRYAPQAQRELNLGHVDDEARAEADDILEGEQRLTSYDCSV